MDPKVFSHLSGSQPWCAFVTADLVEAVSKSPAVSQHVHEAATRTLEIDSSFRGKRVTAFEEEVRPLNHYLPVFKVLESPDLQ